MITQVLIINHQLALTVTIKQALERTGAYSVHPFTSADAASDYLKGHPQSVAVVDFGLPGVRGDALVRRLREIQPNLAIIASPTQSDDVITRLGLQGSLDAPFAARVLVPLLEQATQADAPPAAVAPEPEPPPPPSLRTRILNDVTRDPGATRDFDAGDDRQQIATDSLGGVAEVPRPGTLPLNALESVDVLREMPENPPDTGRLNEMLNDIATGGLFDPDDDPGEVQVDSDELYDLDVTPTDPGADPEAAMADGEQGDLFSALDANAGPPPEPAVDQPPTDQRFIDLVNSMRRGDDQRKPLPQRTQPFVDFILTGGMDTLLNEIERSKGTQPFEENDKAFARLAAEEPPLPTLEESGTIGDLMTGVSDPGFRGVLELLSGEDRAPRSAPVPAQEMSPEEIEAAFAGFYEANEPPESSNRPAEAPEAAPPTQERTPARLILETALDETTPLESFSLDTLIASIDRQLPAHKPNVQPLPSWLRETEPTLDDFELESLEPDFLPEEEPEFGSTGDLSIETTRASGAAAPDAEPAYLETESLEVSPRTRPVLPSDFAAPPIQEDDGFGDFDDFGGMDETPQTSSPFTFDDETPVFEPLEPEDTPHAPAVAASWLDLDELDEAFQETVPHDMGPQPLDPRFERLLNFGDVDEDSYATPTPALPPAPPPQPIAPPVARPLVRALAQPTAQQSTEDRQISQLALNLTHASLESTAEATLLTRGAEIIALAGALASEDVEELRQSIGDDWDTGADQARIRFVTLEGSGTDYMLYSRRTVGDLTLSMVFAGTMPLRDIRRQGKRLLEALEAVPEKPVPPPALAPALERPARRSPVAAQEPESAPALALAQVEPEQPVVRTAYAYVWIVRDPNARLSDMVARAITTGLSTQLTEQAWQIAQLEARDEFVYLLADVPGETPPPEIVRDLKRRSAQIVASLDPTLQGPDLWADSYLVVTPGRALDADEIQQFIDFERMD